MSARWAGALLVLAFLGGVASAQDAKVEVREIAGEVRDITGEIRDIVGMSRGLEGKLADLGAKVTEQEIRFELSGDVLFDFDKATLKAEAIETLAKIAEVLNGYPDAPVLVEGHTDSKGKDSYNRSLSELRAESVRKWLVEEGGVAEVRVTAKGLGETRPVAQNEKPDGSDDPEGRQKNRRVEITVKKG